MSVRSSVLILAAVALAGGAAFYSLGASQKNENAVETSSASATAEAGLNGLAPAAAGEDAKATSTEAKPEEKAADEQKPAAQAQAASEEQPKAPQRSPEEILATHDLQMVYGKDEAPVKVVEYFSLSCPHCGEFYKDHQPQMIKDYVDTGKVQYFKRYFPHNAPGMAATMLMQCVGEDNKTQFLEALFNMQSKWAFTQEFQKDLKSIAQVGGIGPTDFDVCLADKVIEQRVLAQRQEALDGLKIDGIPAMFVNGKALGTTDYARLTKAIDEALKAAAE